MVVLCYSCGTPCKTRKGLENHLKSRPACPDELGISRSSNWAVNLGLSSVTTSSKVINHHLFPVEIDPKVAAKRSVEVMWQDENDFEAVASSPESPLKSLKSSAAASIRGNDVKSSSLIKHFCGTKKIHMTVDQHHSSGLLKNLLLDKHSVPPPAGTSFSLSQI